MFTTGFKLERFKASETLLGIETEFLSASGRLLFGFKASETLLGIETGERQRGS